MQKLVKSKSNFFLYRQDVRELGDRHPKSHLFKSFQVRRCWITFDWKIQLLPKSKIEKKRIRKPWISLYLTTTISKPIWSVLELIPYFGLLWQRYLDLLLVTDIIFMDMPLPLFPWLLWWPLLWSFWNCLELMVQLYLEKYVFNP